MSFYVSHLYHFLSFYSIKFLDFRKRGDVTLQDNQQYGVLSFGWWLKQKFYIGCTFPIITLYLLFINLSILGNL